jgi:hypothetical protein
MYPSTTPTMNPMPQIRNPAIEDTREATARPFVVDVERV